MQNYNELYNKSIHNALNISNFPLLKPLEIVAIYVGPTAYLHFKVMFV